VWGGMNCVTSFDASELWIPRFCKTYCFFNPDCEGTPWATDRPLENIIDSVVHFSSLDDQHHYWFNTLEHGIDGARTNDDPADDNCSVLGLVPYLYEHYGPGGDNTVWVAPSEDIFAYIITQRHSVLSTTTIVPYSGTAIQMSMSEGATSTRPVIARCLRMQERFGSGVTAYDLRGARIPSDQLPRTGVFITRFARDP
jgi:hypothetical protein